jgi:hypothetical protein
MKKRRIHPIAIGASALFAFTLTTRAQFSEPFAYTPGQTLFGQNGGTGFSGAWTEGGDPAEHDTIQAGSLTYPSYPSSGNSGHSVPPSDFIQTPFRDVPTIPGVPGSTLWVSYLLQKNSDNTTGSPLNGDYFGLVLYGPGANEGVLIGDSSESANFALGTAGSPSTGSELSSVPVGLGSTSLLVAKIEFQPGADNISLFVNPNLALGEAGLGAPSATKNDLDLQVIQAIGFVSGFDEVYSYDEIRASDSFAGLVTPVPDSCTAAWILLPCFAAAVRRYRARSA